MGNGTPLPVVFVAWKRHGQTSFAHGTRRIKTCGMAEHQMTEGGATSGPLPVHFFTIVLNGEPYVRHHVGQMKRLPFRWHWHVVEGVAELKHDTAWSLAT